MSLTPYRLAAWIWVAVGAVWLVSAWGAKPSVRRESGFTRLLHIAIMAAGFLLLFPSLSASFTLPVGPLARRFLPHAPAIAWGGAVLTAAGCAFAIWARLLLGANWSGRVTLKQDHQLIARGPYAIVRHPIYSGFLAGLLGTAIALGEWRGLAGLALAFLGWWTKSRAEEAFLAEHFGAHYAHYRRRVKALIPFVV
jgi:protein-S-isoprenylcysteine O-methyltransferase Ste14